MGLEGDVERNRINERPKKKNVLDLSASPQMSLKPVRSKVELMRPASASREPGWAVVSRDWKR